MLVIARYDVKLHYLPDRALVVRFPRLKFTGEEMPRQSQGFAKICDIMVSALSKVY
jgi:hypothetical protein